MGYLPDSESKPPSAGGGPALTAPAPEKKDDELADLPPVKALLQGDPSGYVIPDGVKTPLIMTLAQNLENVLKLGLRVYRSASKAQSVLYNPSKLNDQTLQKLDSEGSLDTALPSLAPAAPEVATPAPGVNPPLPAAPQPAAMAPAVAPAAPPLPQRAQGKLVGSRIKALTPSDPLSGPKPGQGRLINALSMSTI